MLHVCDCNAHHSAICAAGAWYVSCLLQLLILEFENAYVGRLIFLHQPVQTHQKTHWMHARACKCVRHHNSMQPS